jgi:hypothetical protein
VSSSACVVLSLVRDEGLARDEELVTNQADGTLWYAPDAEEEDELYHAAQDDALRREEGLPLEEYQLPHGVPSVFLVCS